MSRKDSKGRILHCGETQRSDGRYAFKYVDWQGKTRTVYSWTLTIHDQYPTDKRKDLCLRQKEQQIHQDYFEHVAPSNMTVMSLVESYISTKTAVRASTKAGYRTVINYLKTDNFANAPISRVTTIEARKWLVYLQKEVGKSYSAICSIRGVLRPAFRLAEESGLVRRNPFDFELIDVLVNDSIARNALTTQQEHRFLDFIRHDEHYRRYYDVMFILLNTGLRISEYCGLTVGDINFERHYVCVNRQLQRDSGMRYYIEAPKTRAGIRFIPMTKSLEEAFSNVISCRQNLTKEAIVDGVGGFLSLDRNGRPCVALHWEHRITGAVKKHNRIYKEELPHITPHMLRHTFCSRMARNGISPAKLKYLMGHSDISTTYNVYTHLQVDDIRNDLLLIEQNRSSNVSYKTEPVRRLYDD